MLVYFRIEKNNILKFKSENQTLIYLLLFFRVLNTLFGYLFFEYNSVTDIISSIIMLFTTITLFYIIPSIVNSKSNTENIFKETYIIICVILSIFSVLIKLNGGHFLLWNYVYVIRDASIYYDPNFCAMILGSGLTLGLLHKYDKKMVKLFVNFIIFIAIIFTGSRGTLLGLLMSILIYLIIYSKLEFRKKIVVLSIFAISTYIGINYLYSIDFFRTYQGSNDRFEMWSNVVNLASKSPLFGYGYGSTNLVLKTINFSYASTHNSFLDFLIIYGYPTFFIYIILILRIIIESLKVEGSRSYILTLIFMIINSNTILYSFGGVGLSSLMFTIILGLLNYSIIRKKTNLNNGDGEYTNET